MEPTLAPHYHSHTQLNSDTADMYNTHTLNPTATPRKSLALLETTNTKQNKTYNGNPKYTKPLTENQQKIKVLFTRAQIYLSDRVQYPYGRLAAVICHSSCSYHSLPYF